MGPRNKSEDDSVKWGAALDPTRTFHPLLGRLMLSSQREYGVAEARLYDVSIIGFQHVVLYSKI